MSDLITIILLALAWAWGYASHPEPPPCPPTTTAPVVVSIPGPTIPEYVPDESTTTAGPVYNPDTDNCHYLKGGPCQ